MGEVDKNLPHALVEDDGVRLLHELSDNFSLVVLDNQNLHFREPKDQKISSSSSTGERAEE
jgi:hypothetical protein